jgi:leukotriene-A4 hydrolase
MTRTNILSVLSLLLFTLLLSYCDMPAPQEGEDATAETTEESRPRDVHTYARPEEARTKHLVLNLDVDFEQRILSGTAHYEIENNNAERIIFDTRDLKIEKVTIGDEEAETTFELGEFDEHLGRPLEVTISPETKVLTIYYQTSPDALALDWLEPQLTADKKHPFLFTQGQAILTRSWIPCQDSPGIRITYEGRVQVPEGMMAVMSASNSRKKHDTGLYTFQMRQPIPPYLIALAVGDLEFRAVGEKTGVYAEPSVVEAAAYEFGDMEKMLKVAEELYGPYQWERYDVIVLPPSFPFGGMENPRLTFATPTIIAGDRSLTSLIAHELAHSWSGNLVTNATWNDFWLNEGFTVYFERRIMEAIYGDSYEDMLAVLGYQDLEEDVNDLGPESEDTHLHLDLDGRDPDDGMTDVAYEKGAFFLTLLEQKVGREVFDAFLKNYFTTHRFKTMTTTEFLDYLKKELLEPNKVEVNIDEWVYGPGIPESCPKVSSERFEQVDKQRQMMLDENDISSLQTEEWTTHEWLYFLRKLPRDLNGKLMVALDEQYKLSESGNSEILNAWFQLAIYSGYSDVILPQIEGFLVRIGRRKFLAPIYRAFKETDQLETARAIFEKAKANYHSVSSSSINTLLNS